MDFLIFPLVGFVAFLQFFMLIKLWKLFELKDLVNTGKAEAKVMMRENREDIISSTSRNIESVRSANKDQMDVFSRQMVDLTKMNETKLEKIRVAVEDQLYKLQRDNSDKLEKMRATVEEKLQDTLEKRLSQSFKIVSERLELVHKGLGEMQTLASGVGDLKKVLSNIKTRGIWGEVQLDALIAQILSPSQYEQNFAVRVNSQDRVECVVKLPGKDEEKSEVYLPIDAKFPLEDYQRLLNAYEDGDKNLIDSTFKSLENAIKKEAKTISEKYIHPPRTTDFAIMFLPIEGLYAEVLKKPGVIEMLQRDYRVIVTSPTTLLAILNSLQMGFKTMAIQKRSSEVWKLLASFKKEFDTFTGILGKTKKKLDEASNVISQAETRTRVIQRKLNKVEGIEGDAENDNLSLDLEKIES